MKAYDYKKMRDIGFFLVITGLLGTLLGLISPSDSTVISPIFIALGVIFAAAGTCKGKKHCNRNFYMTIVAIALIVMLAGEYFFAPAQNRLIFFILMVIVAIGLFWMAYSLLTLEKIRTRKENILSWIVSILFVSAFYGLMAIVFNNYILGLGIGLLLAVIFVISKLINRNRVLKA